MAEVVKKKVEDKYNTESIKKSLKKKEEKKTTKTKKVEKKSTQKKGFFGSIKNFFNGVASEFKRVHWPSKKDMVKYSVATVAFILFFGIFFYLIYIFFSFIISVFS